MTLSHIVLQEGDLHPKYRKYWKYKFFVEISRSLLNTFFYFLVLGFFFYGWDNNWTLKMEAVSVH